MLTLRRPALVLAALVASIPWASAGTLSVPAQFESIQAAVAAAQPGDLVFVQPGLYAETVVISTADIRLVGRGAVIDPAYAGPAIQVEAHNVRIGGFTLRNATYGIRAFGGGLVAIENEIIASSEDGILVYGTDPAIMKNSIVGAAGDGVRLVHPSLAPCPSDVCIPVTGLPLGGSFDQTTVARNTIKQCSGDGIDVRDFAAIIEKNRVTHSGDHGIRANLGGFFGPLGSECVLRRNSCSNNQDCGIYAEDFFASHTVVESNALKLNGEHGLYATGFLMSVRNNRSTDNAGQGIVFSGQNSSIESNMVVRNGDRGIEVMGFSVEGDGSDGPDNTITGNTSNTNGRDGIYAAVGTFAITNNTCRNNTGDGIDLDRVPPEWGGPSGNSGGSVISNNVVKRNNHEGIDNSGVSTLVDSNTCLQNKGADIAGTGDGQGTVASFTSNTFVTGGAETVQALDL